VRIDSLQAGEITMKDILSIDPFYNETMELELSGEDILKVLTTYSRGSLYHLPRVGGIICEAIVDKEDPDKDRLKNVRLKTLDGQEFDIHKTYKVITNSYMASIIPSFIDCTPHSLNIETSKILTNFIGRFETVNYQGVNRLLVTEK
jgi:2',3'-cyclic-nucleotide 2'-phosphodiesterase (5'-nucleotidase family)